MELDANLLKFLNSLNVNPTKWSNTLKKISRLLGDELFECVWPFVGLAHKGLILEKKFANDPLMTQILEAAVQKCS